VAYVSAICINRTFMNQDTLDEAVKAAKRFLELAENLELGIVGTRASGAVKRASMDLTRALTDLRKPG
jgi:hypothetical protein